MAKDTTSYDTLQPIRFGKYSGERLCDLPEGYLHWLLCHADNAAAKGPKFRRSLAWALFNRTNAKLRETFGPLAERVGGFPEVPPGWVQPTNSPTLRESPINA